jgi:ribosomal protein S18 acetylase RimI-like enzyme
LSLVIRSATAADLPACHAVWLRAEDDVPATADPDALLPLHAHELATGRLLVAEADDRVVGFGATLTRSGVAYLADLFVRPESQGRGIGRALLHGLLDEHAGPRFTLASTTPHAQRLYTAFGMHAVEEFSYFFARPSDLRIDAFAFGGIDVVEVGVTDEVLAIDREVTGRDRAADLLHAAEHLDARTFVGRRAGRAVGYASFVYPIWWNPWHPDDVRVGPIAAIEPADTCALLAHAVCITRELDTASLGPFVPVSNPGHRMLLDAGFRIVDTDMYMASDPRLLDRARYLPAVDTA